ncbi:MAG: stage III sporulation protein AH [Firmicutes bacterium HGW-Firmicutes-1]|jgi:stage III sporulation protein AH|nr:MAG: stage III sporulation protein AH [Firmicutes bacterium HGW-Firmicutes-1]
MNTFKKNQIIITALAIMIAIAGYLNFTDKASIKEEKYVFNNKGSDVTQDAGVLVPNEDELTNANVIEEIMEETATTGENVTSEETAIVDEAQKETVGEAVFVSSNSVDSRYFLEEKIDREQTRAYSMEILLGVINNEKLGEEQKIDAAAKMVDLQDRIEKEAAAESILEAKGFEEVFVRMDEKGVDVVVNAEKLTENELAQITDVVARKTGVAAELVVITPLKINK